MAAGDTGGSVDEPRPIDDAEAAPLAPVLANWAYAAGAPYEDWRFGGRETALAVLREWVRRPSSEIAAGRWHICELDGKLAGGVVFLDGDRLAAARRSDLIALARLPAIAELRERLVATRDLFGAVAPDDLYLSRIAVDSNFRGRGVGQRLLHMVTRAAADQGRQRVVLDVAADNAAALNLYERAGFTVVSEGVSEIAGLRYLALELRP